MPSGSVLHVDPDASAREDLRGALAGTSLELSTAGSFDDAADALHDDEFACLVTEFRLNSDGDETTGLDLVERGREASPDLGGVLYTDADRSAVTAAADEDAPVVEYVPKREGGTDRLAALVATTVERRCQTAYPLPDCEADRLAALEGYDLSAPDLQRALDRVTSLATAHLDVPLAAVSTVGKDTQRFLACEGDDWTTLAREETVCTYTLLEEGVTVVEDLTEDPRFVANETLEELGIQFYAGAPLRTPDGLPLGTLCVYDETPASVTEAERSSLALLAEEASHWLEVYGRDDERRDEAGADVEGPS